MSTLTSSIRPARFPASASMIGPSVRHGPHHGAQKSTTTGISRERSITSRSKVAVVTSMYVRPFVSLPGRFLDERAQRPELILDGPADLLAEAHRVVVDDPVVDAGAVLAAADDAGVGEHGQVLRDVLLRRAELVCQVVHACLARTQPDEGPDAQRLGHRAKAPGHELDELVGKRIG